MLNLCFLFSQFSSIEIFIVKSRVVSLESLSSVEYQIKTVFLYFAFPRS